MMKNLGKKKGGGSVKGVGKGMPSAVLLSILIHAGLFLLAGLLVVFTVTREQEPEFEAPKAVDRPKIKLKKPKVKMKKSSKPKSITRIVTPDKREAMPDMQLPEMSGLGDGLGGGIGGGIDMMMPDIEEISVFGSEKSIGSDFEGQVYSLALGRDGRTTTMNPDMFREKLRKFVLDGWDERVLAPYYRSPNKLYSTFFIVPPIPASLGPDAFGVPDLKLYFLFVKYEGQLVYPEDIKIRFRGVGDAYIFVHVGGKEVLLSRWSRFHSQYFDWWQSSAGGDRSHVLGNQFMVVGDWIELKAGEPLDMKVLFGQWKGGEVSGMLLVEVEGEEYPTSRNGGPLLPAFKTAELSWDQLTEVSRYLAADECSLTNGPVFNDYYTAPTSPKTGVTAVPEPEPEVRPAAPSTEESGMRLWTLADGKTMEAEFMTMVGPDALMQNARGRQVKVPMKRFSDSDCSYIRLSSPPDLDINFSKTTKQRKFGTNYDGKESPIRGSFYTFSTRIKQTSVRPYGLGLTAEFFAIGDEIGGDKYVLLDYQKAGFTLTKENDFTFKFSGRRLDMIDYVLQEERRGQRYGGYLVLVKDSRGEIIAHAASSKRFFENRDSLMKIKVGWYFDKDCNRCLPTPPRPWELPRTLN